MRIKEITREEFFANVESINDIPDIQLSVSNWGEIAKDEHGDIVLSLDEVKSWTKARFFVNVSNPRHYEEFYLIRPTDDDDNWDDQFLKMNTQWYHFRGVCWSGEDNEPYPHELICYMHGEHVTNRRTVIYEGSGYDEDRPFEDLVTVMADLAMIYRLLNLSEVQYREVELWLKNEMSGFVWKYKGSNKQLKNPLPKGSKVFVDGVECTVHYEVRQMGGGHGEGRWEAEIATLKDAKGEPVYFHGKVIKTTMAVHTRTYG